jgi:hypothetical protein
MERRLIEWTRVARWYMYFQTKKFGKFRSVLQRKILVNFMAIWCISLPCGTNCGHVVYFVAILVYFSVLVYCTKKNLATVVVVERKKCCEEFPDFWF